MPDHQGPHPGVLDARCSTRTTSGWLQEFFAPGFVNHNARPGTPAGPEGARQVFSRLWAGCETGLITEHLAVRDDVTVFRQLGALPAAISPTGPAPVRQAC